MSAKSTRPLLSICIPTYNRANLLEISLQVLIPQINAFSPQVELLVSDNCSSDRTPEVIAQAQTLCPIVYHRNPENIGATRNMQLLSRELARGEFLWIIGDDDIVRPDGVERLLGVIKQHPDIDYIYVNVSIRMASEFPALNTKLGKIAWPELLPAKSADLDAHLLSMWEEVIDPDIDAFFLGGIMSSIVRASRWRSYSVLLRADDRIFDNLNETYSHAVVLAHTMPGAKAYYMGYPCVVAFLGEHQDWTGYLPLIYLVRLQELLDLYHECGVSRQRVERCRHYLLKAESIRSLYAMLTDRTLPGREYFSLRRFLWQNRRHPLLLARTLIQVYMGIVHPYLPRSLQKAWRAAKHKLLRTPVTPVEGGASLKH